MDHQLKPLRFLFADYRPDKWYFEIVEMVGLDHCPSLHSTQRLIQYRRMLLISALPFMGKPSTRAFAGVALSIASIILYRETMPFKQASVNLLVVVAQYTILLTFVGALVTETDSLPLHNVALGVFLVFINLLVIGLATAMGIRSTLTLNSPHDRKYSSLFDLSHYRYEKKIAEQKEREMLNRMAFSSFEFNIIRRIMDGSLQNDNDGDDRVRVSLPLTAVAEEQVGPGHVIRHG